MNLNPFSEVRTMTKIPVSTSESLMTDRHTNSRRDRYGTLDANLGDKRNCTSRDILQFILADCHSGW